MSIEARSGRAVPTASAFLLAHEWLWAVACYLALGVIFLWPAIWFGQVPLPLMNPYARPDPVWEALAPPGIARGANLLLGDLSGFYYPYVAFTITSLRHGQFPLWNPDLFGGMPYFAANQAALLYPINLISYWFGPYSFWTIAALLRLLIAGCGMYALMRRLGSAAPGALLSGGVYMFAAFNVVWLNFAIDNVAALLPLALWLELRLIERPSASVPSSPLAIHEGHEDHEARSLKTYTVVGAVAFSLRVLRVLRGFGRCNWSSRRLDVLALAGVVAAQMFGGHPETSLFFMVLCAFFAVVWLVGRGAWRTAGPLLVLALALGLALSAVQWLPTAELIRKSMTLQERGFLASASHVPAPDFAVLGGLHLARWDNLRHWLLLIAPDLWGSPRGVHIHYWMPEPTNYNEMASYAGLVALALACFGALRGPNRRARGFFAGLLLASLVLLYPLPAARLVGQLPLLDVAPGVRFGLGVALGVAVLAGFGLEWLRTAGSRARWGLALALAALALLNLAIIYDLWGGQRVCWALGFTPGDATRAVIAQVYAPGNWWLFLPGAAGLLAALTLALTARRRLLRARVEVLLVAIALIEVVGYGYGYNGFTPPDAIYPRTSVLARLQRDPQPLRVLNLDETLWANSAMTQGLQVTGGLDDLVPARQQHVLERGMAGVVRMQGRHVVLDWGQRLMDLMSVGYVLSNRAVTQGPRGPALPLEFADGDVRVYRNDTALPRAYAVSSVVPATASTDEDAVFDPRFDPHRAVVLDGASPGFGPAAPLTPVPVVSYTPNQVELAPNLPARAVVVLTDSYDPDWQVTIDDQPARLWRANALLRGVIVPAGRHRVVFSYRPRMVALGALASGIALLGCLVVALWPRRRQHDSTYMSRLVHHKDTKDTKALRSLW